MHTCFPVTDEPTDQPLAQHITVPVDPVFIPRIPVLGKSPHPPGFSYPIGASAIGEGLMGIAQFDRFTLRYSNRSPIFTMPRPVKGFPMLRVTYTNYPVYEPRPGTITRLPQGGERWAIEVLPTPAESREFIQGIIKERGLPLLREWLAGPECPTPESRRTAKACWFVIETNLVKWIDDNSA